MANKIVIGFLIVTILLTGIIYVTMDNVKIRVDNYKSTFYVLEDSYWRVSGREYNKLFDGTSRMNRRSSGINVTSVIDGMKYTITRYTPYIRGPKIVDTYEFDGNISDVESFPISHTIEIYNGTGYIYQYEVRDIIYDGLTIKNVESPQKFGRQMELEWNTDSSYWNTLYKSEILKIRYRIESDYESYKIRLFDPVIDSVDSYTYIYSNCVDVDNELTLSSSKSDLNCMKTCTGKIPLYQNVTKTKKEPVYKDVTTEACCPSMNKTCYTPCVNKTLPCKNNYCELDTHQVIDHYIEVKYNVSELIGYKCRIGVKVGDKTYDDNKGINIVDDKTLVEWNVPQADRNYDEYGSCRDYEREKGTCTETKLEVSAII